MGETASIRMMYGAPVPTLWQYILDETSGEHYEEHLGVLMDGV
jgi:hypothetical protein